MSLCVCRYKSTKSHKTRLQISQSQNKFLLLQIFQHNVGIYESIIFELIKEPGLFNQMDLNGFVHVPNYKYTEHCIQYTSTNTRFSYTFIYEHTDKILLTHNDIYKQNIDIEGGWLRRSNTESVSTDTLCVTL